jgi:Lrp/AsnC family leucine-responsive transcriptional regulator
MGRKNEEDIDEISWRLLEALQENARLSYAELARRVGLSPPSVAERMRRLEDIGVITGYGVRLDRSKLGYALTAFIRLKTPNENYRRVEALAHSQPEILECHHVAGEDSFVLKVAAASVKHLDRLILKLAPFGPTTSTIVLGTKVEDKPVTRSVGDSGR